MQNFAKGFIKIKSVTLEHKRILPVLRNKSNAKGLWI